jgi:CMP-N-acetylneuraminic acid synthetase
MLCGQPLTAIIPVRGGSKGIPRKNVRPIGGQSLLERAIRFGLASSRIDRVIVSTDDAEMHAIATRFGVQSPTLRPPHLADDTATTVAVVDHVTAECGVTSGTLLILQATSPFRRLADLEAMCTAFESTPGAEASVSLVAHDEPRPEKMKRVVDGRIVSYLPQGFEGPRQSLPQPFRLNGAFYLIGLSTLQRERRFIPPGTLAFVMDEAQSHNLDTKTDWQIMEAMIAAGFWSFETLA